MIARGLAGFNYNQLLFGLITVAPPLFILLFSSVGMALLGLFVAPKVSLLLAVGLIIFIGNIFFVLFLSRVPKEIWQALWGIPLFIWNQVTALFKMANPNKNFKHTEHKRSVSIEEVLKQSKEESKSL